MMDARRPIASIEQVSGLQSSLTAAVSTSDSANKHHLVAGVITRDSGSWAFIDNASHRRTGLASVTENAGSVRVTYDQAFGKVVSFVACPDETYVACGYSFGASVGTAYADIYAWRAPRSMSGYVYYDGAAWQVASGSTGNLAVSGFANGVLSLTHTPMDPYGVSVSNRVSSSILAVPDSVGASSMTVKFVDFAGASVITPSAGMRVFIQRTCTGGGVDPSTLTIAGSNIWILGVFEEAQ